MRHYSVKLLFSLLPCIIIGQSIAAVSEYELLQQLRADYVVLLQARTEFEQSYQKGNLARREHDDLSAWVSQLSDQVAQGCRQLSIVSTKPLPPDLPCDQIMAGQPAPAAINISTESTESEATARMIEQFNGSLGEFDERLLREQDRIKDRKPRTETTSSASAGGASGGQGEADGSEAEEGREGKASSEKSASRSSTQGSVEEGTPGSSSEKGGPGKSLPGTKSSAPADIPDGSNDDVVARQLREAAEKETDPELKKKLWDEYRRYKSGEL